MELEAIKSFLDKDGRIKSYPSKQSKLLLVLEYLSVAFDDEKIYTESEVNEIILDKITFSDFATLRRDLIDFGFLTRNKNGTEYRPRKVTGKSGIENNSCADSKQTLD